MSLVQDLSFDPWGECSVQVRWVWVQLFSVKSTAEVLKSKIPEAGASCMSSRQPSLLCQSAIDHLLAWLSCLSIYLISGWRQAFCRFFFLGWAVLLREETSEEVNQRYPKKKSLVIITRGLLICFFFSNDRLLSELLSVGGMPSHLSFPEVRGFLWGAEGSHSIVEDLHVRGYYPVIVLSCWVLRSEFLRRSYSTDRSIDLFIWTDHISGWVLWSRPICRRSRLRTSTVTSVVQI